MNEQAQVERAQAEAYQAARDIGGVGQATYTAKQSTGYYVECKVPGLEDPPHAYESDMLIHFYSLPENTAPWFPKDSKNPGQAIKSALEAARVKARLQTKVEPWCIVSWEPAALPQLIHSALSFLSCCADQWLLSAEVPPATLTGSELLERLERGVYGMSYDGANPLDRRFRVAEMLKTNGFTPSVLRFQENAPISPEAQEPDLSFLDALFPVRSGSWCATVRHLTELVMDPMAFVDLVVGALPQR